MNVIAGPGAGVRRTIGKVPPQTMMSFPAVLAPGRNEAVAWVDPDDVAKHKLTAARVRGTISIVDRKNATCLRSAQLAIDAASFDASRTRRPGELAPGAGARNVPKPKDAIGAPR